MTTAEQYRARIAAERDRDLMLDRAVADHADTARHEHVVDHAESLGKTDILKRVTRALEHMYLREIVRMMIEHMPDEYEQLEKEATGGEFGDHFPPTGIPGPGD